MRRSKEHAANNDAKAPTVPHYYWAVVSALWVFLSSRHSSFLLYFIVLYVAYCICV